MKVERADAERIGKLLGIKFDKFSIESFTDGMNVEMEHGKINELTNVTNDDLVMTGKIALAHLLESPDYYERLEEMEKGMMGSDNVVVAWLGVIMWGMGWLMFP